MIAFAIVVSVTITIITLLLIGQSSQERAYAQNQTQATNFTQLFSTDKQFQLCTDYLPECLPIINVLYQDPNLLVLSSDYVDVIWEGVARAQKEGYQIDSMTSYSTTIGTSGDAKVNLLVAMSK